MARRQRHVVPGQPLHIIQRGNNRAACFAATQDYAFYLSALREASLHARCAVHAYVLMGNHAHLLVTPVDAQGPGRMMQLLGRRFVRYFNHAHERTGTLWEGRYRSCLIDSGRYFFVCSRYIEMNPVRARLVEHPAEYPWTSFHHNALGKADRLLAPHPAYEALGKAPIGRQRAYRELFERQIEPGALDAIRRATNAGAPLPADEMHVVSVTSAGQTSGSAQASLL